MDIIDRIELSKAILEEARKEYNEVMKGVCIEVFDKIKDIDDLGNSTTHNIVYNKRISVVRVIKNTIGLGLLDSKNLYFDNKELFFMLAADHLCNQLAK
jgi:ribosomal protein L7/L12